MMNGKLLTIIGTLLLLILLVDPTQAQISQSTENAKTDSDTTAFAAVDSVRSSERPEVYEEQILETIRIEAVVEKPSVTLIPKRAETKIEEVPLSNRSFAKELNTKPEFLKDYGKELEKGKRVKQPKKSLDKKDR